MRPGLTFFCELETRGLLELLADGGVIKTLKSLRAGMSLSVQDLSPERAQMVQQLNREGIPVTAWLLLPKEQGYWPNVDNAPLAVEHYAAFEAWTAEYGLAWAGVGLGIQPDIHELGDWLTQRQRVLPVALRRLLQARRLRRARKIYRGLVERVRQTGYRVESYVFPVIADERKVLSTLLQRIFGVVDIPADREVMVLYSSYVRPYGPGVIWAYAPDSQAIALGSTGGGAKIPISGAEPLTWDELARDLIHAWYWKNELYVFSLEGCVQNGYLDRLKTLDWDRPIIPPEALTRRVQGWRATLQSTLWAASHLTTILLLLAGVLLILTPLRRKMQ